MWWDGGESKDPKGTEEIQVWCLKMDQHLENLENQDKQDLKDLKESRGVQVAEEAVSNCWCCTCTHLYFCGLTDPLLSSSGSYCLSGASGESGQPGTKGPAGNQGFPGFKGQYWAH